MSGSGSPDPLKSEKPDSVRDDRRVCHFGYDKASKIAHFANDNDLTLRAAALKLGFVTEEEFDRVVDPTKKTRMRRCLRRLAANVRTQPSGGPRV
jgi:hypothetical protein